MAIRQEKREAVKGLLGGIMRASLGATRGLEGFVEGADQVKAERMNMMCAEYLYLHMWRACKRAVGKMGVAEYKEFSNYAVKGLAVMAVGCFTGVYDTNAEAEFLVGLQGAFARLDRCGPEGNDAMVSKGVLGMTARRVARMAGRGGEREVVDAAMVAGMESYNVSRVEGGVDLVVGS